MKISDIDRKGKVSIVRCFAGDARVSKMIGLEKDEEKMQEDMNMIQDGQKRI